MSNTPFKWTDESRTIAVEEYKNRMGEIPEEDRPSFTQEVAQAVATELGCTLNSCRNILQKAKNPDGSSVYISKAASKTKSASPKEGTVKRRSKAESHADLVAIISSIAGPDALDMEVIEKLTGKAADYFISLFQETQGE